eukprot:6209036-Pleurochrysis_carterae.AAC.1
MPRPSGSFAGSDVSAADASAACGHAQTRKRTRAAIKNRTHFVAAWLEVERTRRMRWRLATSPRALAACSCLDFQRTPAVSSPKLAGISAHPAWERASREAWSKSPCTLNSEQAPIRRAFPAHHSADATQSESARRQAFAALPFSLRVRETTKSGRSRALLGQIASFVAGLGARRAGEWRAGHRQRRRRLPGQLRAHSPLGPVLHLLVLVGRACALLTLSALRRKPHRESESRAPAHARHLRTNTRREHGSRRVSRRTAAVASRRPGA